MKISLVSYPSPSSRLNGCFTMGASPMVVRPCRCTLTIFALIIVVIYWLSHGSQVGVGVSKSAWHAPRTVARTRRRSTFTILLKTQLMYLRHAQGKRGRRTPRSYADLRQFAESCEDMYSQHAITDGYVCHT
eukprot:1322423-Amorphochlora_amoeboformis.AAC.3